MKKTLNSIALELVKLYGSNSQVKAAKAEIMAKYGVSPDEWHTLRSEAAKLRLQGLRAEAQAARSSALSFDKWIAAGFEILRRDAAFVKLFASWESSKAKDADFAAFVAAWYPFVDKAGECLKPQSLYRLTDDGKELRATTFVAWEKQAKDAAIVIGKAFENWTRANIASRCAKPVNWCNIREVGIVYSVAEYDKITGKWTKSPGLCESLDSFTTLADIKASGVQLPHLADK